MEKSGGDSAAQCTVAQELAMIITHIIGGLGNQMFQYAAGRALSLRHSATLRLDISSFADYGLHQGFELNKLFDHATEIADETDIRRILGWQSRPPVRKVLSRRRLAAIRRKEFVVEPYFDYWPQISEVRDNSYLTGYWQSEKYFMDAAPIIRADLTFKLPLTDRNAELREQIRQVNAVSLHIRRGDYVSNNNTNATHGVCPIDYYLAGVQYMSDHIKQPYFFIFSDDVAWVKDNLRINFPCQVIDHNHGAESYNDMRLMSLCRHHIIANSSFSWWGAWLNPDAAKIVVAPKRWFANHSTVPDLMPHGWVRI